LEAEEVILGAVLLDPSEADELIGSDLSQDHFFHQAHAQVYGAIVALSQAGEHIDLVTVANHLREKGQLDTIGGMDKLQALYRSVPTLADVSHYREILWRSYVLRSLHALGTSLREEVIKGDQTSEPLIETAEKRLFELRGGALSTGFSSLADLAPMVQEKINQHALNQDRFTGLKTGFTRFDNMTSGLQKGDLIIVAARPAMGKTAFCLNLAKNVATENDTHVAVFSLEMSGEQLTSRLIAAEARISISRLRRGQLEEEEWPLLADAVSRLSTVPLLINDRTEASLGAIRGRLNFIHRQYPLGLIVIDYLQLMNDPTSLKSGNRTNEISAISRGLKLLAKELELPIIALSQLSRAAEHRSDHRPQLSDLRESGSIEQDADIVCFLYRQAYYDRIKQKDENAPIDEPQEGQVEEAELIIAKHRNGATGRIPLAFTPSYTKFNDMLMDDHY
jgi:replicative DNA helicase